MKKTILLFFFGFLTSLSISAETQETEVTATETIETTATETAVTTSVLTDETASNVSAYQNVNIYHAPCVYNVSGYDNLMSLTSPDGSTYNAGYKQDPDWRSARTLRNIGCGVCLAGIATTVAGVIMCTVGITNTITEAEDTDALRGDIKDFTTGVYLIIPGALVTTAGAIMWGVGNHKMKKSRLKFTGNGLSYNF